MFRSREALDTGRPTTVTVKSTSSINQSINQSRDIIADEEQEAKKGKIDTKSKEPLVIVAQILTLTET